MSSVACRLKLAACAIFYSHGTINKNATCTRMSMQNQNVKPIIFLSVLAEPENSEECTCHSAWSNTLKPSGNCLPVHQGLLVINQVLDPRSIVLSSCTGVALSSMDQGSRAKSCIAIKPERTRVALCWVSTTTLFLTQYNT